MNLTVDLDREADGRWIAEIPELNILLYGASRDAAIREAEAAARLIIADRILRGTLPEAASHAVFAVSVRVIDLPRRRRACSRRYSSSGRSMIAQ